MTDSYILIAVLGALLIASEVRHYCAERRWFLERKDINNRLMAGSLRDYAVHAPLVEPHSTATAKVAPVEPTIEEMTSLSLDVTLPADVLAGAQTSYKAVMGD